MVCISGDSLPRLVSCFLGQYQTSESLFPSIIRAKSTCVEHYMLDIPQRGSDVIFSHSVS